MIFSVPIIIYLCLSVSLFFVFLYPPSVPLCLCGKLSLCSVCAWLLLAYAVNGSKPIDKVRRVYPYNPAIRELSLDNLQCLFIILTCLCRQVAKDRDQHSFIPYI